MSDLKEQLYKKLKAKGLSISFFARQVDIPQARIYKWYQQGTTPKPEDAIKIEKWLNEAGPETATEPSDDSALLAVLFDQICELLARQNGTSALQERRRLIKLIQEYRSV